MRTESLSGAASCVVSLVVAFLVFPVVPTPQARAEHNGKTRFIQGTFENDLFSGSDRYYTGGFQVMWGEKGGEANFLSRPLERFLCGHNCDDSRRVLYSQKIGQLIYTPADISVSGPQPNDRMYGAFLYYGAESLFVGTDPTVTRSVGYQIGMVGPVALGEQAQDVAHHLTGSEKPQGWEHQLHNEPAFVVTYMLEKRLVRARHDLADGALWVSVGGGVGNLATFGGTGIKYAIGRNLPLQINPSQVGPKTLPLSQRELSGLESFEPHGNCLGIFSACFVFVGADVRVIAHNMFLDGNSFQHNNGNVNKEPFFYDLVIGFRAAFNSGSALDGWYINFSQTRRSAEFKSPDGISPAQSFGNITIGREF